MAKRRTRPADLKARISSETLLGDETIAQLASRYNIHPNLITNWKRQAQKGLSDIFGRGSKRRNASREAEIQQLQTKIGELVIERDFWARIFDRWAGDSAWHTLDANDLCV